MFYLGTQTWENKRKKNKNGTNVPDPGKLVHSSSVVAFQIARVTRCSVVDMKQTGDISPLKRIRLRSHAASELKANRSMRARERQANVGIAQISGTKKSFFFSRKLSCTDVLPDLRKPP